MQTSMKLRKEGKSIRAIGQTLGIASTTIWNGEGVRMLPSLEEAMTQEAIRQDRHNFYKYAEGRA